MSALFRLALLSAWNRSLSLGLTVLAVLMASTLLLSVERLRHAASDGFAQSVSGTDLIVGARGGTLQPFDQRQLHPQRRPPSKHRAIPIECSTYLVMCSNACGGTTSKKSPTNN